MLPTFFLTAIAAIAGNKAGYSATLVEAGGQGRYLKSLHYLGGSSEAKNRKNSKKVKCDGWTDGRTDGSTDGRTDKAGCRVT